MAANREYFPLTPPQEMIHFMLKYSFFHKQVIQIPACVTLKREVNLELMKKAVYEEVKRNDCMRLRFEKKGGKVRQYFLDEVPESDIDVKIMEFKTKEEQDSVLGADAQKTVKCFKGEIFRIIF